MKVVHINKTDFGGAAMAALRLHEGLLASGMDSKFLTYSQKRRDLPEHYKLDAVHCSRFPAMTKLRLSTRRRLKDLGLIEDVEKKYLQNRPEGFEIFTFPFADFDLTKHPLVKEADIIHLHWVARGLLNYPTFFRQKNKKVLWTLHDMNPFTGGCHHADGCLEYQRNCFPCPQLKRTRDETMARTVLSLKSKATASFPEDNMLVATPSKWLLKLADASLVLKRFPKLLIPNGVNGDIFHYIPRAEARKTLQLPAHKKIILFASSDLANPRKGAATLMEAVGSIQRPANVIVCTLGDARNFHFSCPDIDVISLYTKNEMKLALAYAAADAMVLPSLAENFPNVICESLMCGTPVIAYAAGGIPEQVNEQNGLLVPPGDLEKLKSCIEEIVGGAGQFNAEQISKDAASKYSIRSVVRQYAMAYAGLIGSESKE